MLSDTSTLLPTVLPTPQCTHTSTLLLTYSHLHFYSCRSVLDKIKYIEAESNQVHLDDPPTNSRLQTDIIQCYHSQMINSIQATTEDIAMQVDMGMEMVAAVRGVKVEEIYKLVGTHHRQYRAQ